MRLIFAGTPEPAVPALERLLNSDHEIVAVITRPDAPRGRGRTLHPSPVSKLAQEHSIEVLTPTSLKSDTEDGQALRARLAELAPDCIPVVAYGNLITEDLLNVPAHGWVNLHFSLLPAWRGAAPVQSAINAGDDITGASTFRIEKGLDTGPILGTVTENMRPTDTADDLLTRLAHSGAELLAVTMDGLAAGQIQPQPQQGEASYAPKITTADAQIDWSQPAFAIDRHIRAHTPGPGAWTRLSGERVKVGPVTLPDVELTVNLRPGQLQISKDAVLVGTGTTPVELEQIQPPSKKMMKAADWSRGLHETDGLEFA